MVEDGQIDCGDLWFVCCQVVVVVERYNVWANGIRGLMVREVLMGDGKNVVVIVVGKFFGSVNLREKNDTGLVDSWWLWLKRGSVLSLHLSTSYVTCIAE